MESVGKSLYFSVAFGVVVPLSLLCLVVLVWFCCCKNQQCELDQDKRQQIRVVSPMSLSVLATPCRSTPMTMPSTPFLQGLPTPRYTPPTPLVPTLNNSTPFRATSMTDMYATVEDKVPGHSSRSIEVMVDDHYMVPRRFQRTSASTATLHRVSADVVPCRGLSRKSASTAALHRVSAPVDLGERLDAATRQQRRKLFRSSKRLSYTKVYVGNKTGHYQDSRELQRSELYLQELEGNI